MAAPVRATDSGPAFASRSVSSAVEVGADVVAEPGSSPVAPLIQMPSPSAYYKSRNTKSTVRVRGGDASDVETAETSKSSTGPTEEAAEPKREEGKTESSEGAVSK